MQRFWPLLPQLLLNGKHKVYFIGELLSRLAVSISNAQPPDRPWLYLYISLIFRKGSNTATSPMATESGLLRGLRPISIYILSSFMLLMFSISPSYYNTRHTIFEYYPPVYAVSGRYAADTGKSQKSLSSMWVTIKPI